MTDNFFDFPRKEDWLPIEQASSIDNLFALVDGFKLKVDENQSGLDSTTLLSLIGFIDDFYQRMGYVGRSYILMMYYYEKGIPDEKSHADTSNKEVYWYPDFEKGHWPIKGWFDYFSDVFYYQIFSLWDCIGHILNEQYHLGLELERVTFKRAVGALEHSDKELFQKLQDLMDSSIYREAQRIRNDIAHKHLPNVPGMIVAKQKKPSIGISSRIYGLKNYITANQIRTNAREALGLLEKILDYMTVSAK